MSSHYEVESSSDGNIWSAIGGIFHSLYEVIFRRDHLQEMFEESTFRAVIVTREPIDVEMLDDT